MDDFSATASAIARALWDAGVRFSSAPPRPLALGPRTLSVWLPVDSDAFDTALRAERRLRSITYSSTPLVLQQDGAYLKVEVPLLHPDPIHTADMAAGPMSVQLGVSSEGYPVMWDMGRPTTPHLFIVCPSGGGKSVLLQTIVATLARWSSPDDLTIVAIDGNNMTFADPLDRLAHLQFQPATTDQEAAAALAWCNEELGRRLLAGLRTRDHPMLLLVIDEFWQVPDELVEPLVKTGAKVNLHVVAATQDCSRDMGVKIRRNFGARVCGPVAPGDWRVSQEVIGSTLALCAAGPGDMFAMLGSRPVRFQAAWAPLNDRTDLPDDPWWSDPQVWGGITVSDLPVATSAAGAMEKAPVEPIRFPQRRVHPTQQPKQVSAGALAAVEALITWSDEGRPILPGALKARGAIKAVDGEAGTRLAERLLCEIAQAFADRGLVPLGWEEHVSIDPAASGPSHPSQGEGSGPDIRLAFATTS